MHVYCSIALNSARPACLPVPSMLKGLYPSVMPLHSWVIPHHISVILMRPQLWNSNSSKLVSHALCRHLQWVSRIHSSNNTASRYMVFSMCLTISPQACTSLQVFSVFPTASFKAHLGEVADHFARKCFPGFVKWLVLLLRQFRVAAVWRWGNTSLWAGGKAVPWIAGSH